MTGPVSVCRSGGELNKAPVPSDVVVSTLISKNVIA